MTDIFLIMLPHAGGGEISWLTADADGAVCARGQLRGSRDAEPKIGAQTRVIAVVPATNIALHWVDLPAAAPAQAQAAAQLMAAELSAVPLDDQHVAIGDRVDGNGRRVLAVVAREQMDGWRSALTTRGVAPDALVPAPLLLPVDEGRTTIARDGAHVLVRGDGFALHAEPDLAEIVVPPAGARLIKDPLDSIFAAGAARDIGLNLLQGAYRPPSRLRISGGQLKRLAGLAIGVLVAIAAIPAVSAIRYNFAADRERDELAKIASTVSAPGTAGTDPAARVGIARAISGGDGSLVVLAADVYAAVRAESGVHLTKLQFGLESGLEVTLAGDSAAAGRVAERLRAAELRVTPAAPGTFKVVAP